MLYSLLRPVALVALRLYYRRIESVGLERVPRIGPLLVVVNHPNALVDALVVGTLLPRRLHLTAKATLFGNPIAAWFLSAAGVIPLRRAKDERAAGVVDPDRNATAFRAITETLRRGGALLIFPEGITHDEPALAPLKTGAARIALHARDEAGVRGLTIVPIGLTFSRKDAPRSRVLADVGDPLPVDDWSPETGRDPVAALTAEITRRLHAVTLNFSSMDDAEQARALSGMLVRLLSAEAPSLDEGGPSLLDATAVARRIEKYRGTLASMTDEHRARVARFVEELDEFQATLRQHDLRAEDLAIARDIRSGARFALRESWIVLLGGPAALWGEINHWLPFRAARALAMRSVESAADPAMRTIVAGAALVVITYGLQGLIVFRALGGLAAALYLASLPLAAEINFRFRERLRRATRRARAYIRFRRDPAFHLALLSRAAALRAEALRLEDQSRR